MGPYTLGMKSRQRKIPIKHHKRILKSNKVHHGVKHHHRHPVKKNQRITFSPIYQNHELYEKEEPLYHSDEYKPLMYEQQQTQQVYDTFIDNQIVNRMKNQSEEPVDIIRQLEDIHIQNQYQ